uniref:rho GTPase-activating protein SYDE1-like n=1 Tax=Pristiophorus japonicus TaxID=55135 RepID=UPI00398F7906
MAEPLLRKTFAKLRARRRKSLKGGRSEESDVVEKSPIATNPEAVQLPKCDSSGPGTDRTNSSGSCSRSASAPGLCPSAVENVGGCGADYAGCTVCPPSLAQRAGREQGGGPTGQGGDPARKTKDAMEEVGGEIWYNPIPEDEVPVPVLRRTETSRAQWYVEVPCPMGAETLASNGARRPSCVAATPSATETVQEPSATRCAAETSPPNTRGPSRSTPAVGVSWVGGQAASTTHKLQVSDVAPDARMEGGRSPLASPKPAKKSAAAQRSLSDRVKSPGTVRKLSMRMKKLPELRRKLSLRGTSRAGRHDKDGGGGAGENARPEPAGGASPPPPPAGASLPVSNRNVICRYHLDSSVSGREGQRRQKKQRSARSLGKGGYLSDGDSPELVAKADKPGDPWSPEKDGATAKLDMGTFRPYGGSEQPRCLQYLSGLINVRLYGIEGAKLPRAGLRDVFCAIQVDGVSRARTAMLSCHEPFLSLDHTFNIELEHSQQLKLLLFSWDPGSCRNRVCCYGTAVLPPLFKGARTHQLAMKLEPRGVLYLKVSLVELWEVPLCCADDHREPKVFRLELGELVEREHSGARVPLLIQKCVSEIEKRGLKAVGVYRLCGSAAVKKELRDFFERDSAAVDLSEGIYPDINVITGILKDYLRELPSPLITKTLYEAVLEATAMWPLKMTMGVPEAIPSPAHTVALLDCLPDPEKATLTVLLDHLSLVASLQESNKMTCQNLAVCFGPVLLGQKQEISQSGARTFSHSKELASALDFKRHIEVLHYLLQLWPSDRIKVKRDMLVEQTQPSNCLRPRQQPPALVLPADEVVCRNRVGRAASSSRNRHAGDWSGCGRNYLGPDGGAEVADRGQLPTPRIAVLGAQVPSDRQDSCLYPGNGQDGSSYSGNGQDVGSYPGNGQDGGSYPGNGQDGGSYPGNRQDGCSYPGNGQDNGSYPIDDELDFESAITGRTKDFDSLIADIERELAKKIIFL